MNDELTDRQTNIHVIFSIVSFLVIGISINIISNDATIFIKLPQTIIYIILAGIVWYKISPAIAKKIIPE